MVALSQPARRPCPCPRATPADLDVLREGLHVSKSGFSCVFPHGNRFRAKVLKRVYLGSYPTAADAASAVVHWYRGLYGDRWAQVFRFRKANAWRVSPLRKGGYIAKVWVGGRCHEVFFAATRGKIFEWEPDAGVPGGVRLRLPARPRWPRGVRRQERDAFAWPTPEAAQRAVKAWAYHQLGLFAPLLLCMDRPLSLKKR